MAISTTGKYWVVMTDKFMSNWGQAEGKINKLVIECDSSELALIVADNADQRDEMKYVSIKTECPSFNSKRYLVSYKTQADMPNWFVAGFFK